MHRCPVHDVVHEENEPCPRLGDGSDLGFTTANHEAYDGDCEMHRVPKLHEKKRVLASGGKWDEANNRAVAA